MDFNTICSSMKFKNDAEKKKIELLFNNYMEDIPDNFSEEELRIFSGYLNRIYNNLSEK